MKIKEGFLYHIFNQGNNRRRIFYERENYLFFLNKLKTYIIPYADVIAWCLMPNHFQLMVHIGKEFIWYDGNGKILIESEAEIVQGYSLDVKMVKKRTFNDSFGILLRSYTRAINKRLGFSDALFRKETNPNV